MRVLLLLLLGCGLYYVLRRKQLTRWVVPAAVQRVKTWFIRRPTPVHVLFCFVDHFEPSRGDAPPEVAAERLGHWLDRWPELAAAHRDNDGLPAKHTWFYPYDEWRDGEVAALSRLCYQGYGEVELHLHHDHDTSNQFAETIREALTAFGQHGALLTAEAQPRRSFGFIHGNWALDNSRPDGRWCGVNDELKLLAELGCYADFTLPTPDETQPRMVNQIYRATDDPERPRSHDWGRPLTADRRVPGDLVLIPGPLGINFRDWHHGWYPAIERSEIAASSPVTPARVEFWIRTGVGVVGRPEWVFVKVHAHGCLERDQDDVLGDRRALLHDLLWQRYADGDRYALHYCTARELYNLAIAAEDGAAGEPARYRDHVLPPPVNTKLLAGGPVAVEALTARQGDLRPVGAAEVDWRLKVGPVASVNGPVKRLTWSGEQVELEADGPVELRRR